MDNSVIVDELQAAHEAHIQKLKALHESELSALQTALQQSRQQCEKLAKEKEEAEADIEGMKVEVGQLRESFDLIQGRLKRVLVDQDDLVKLLQLVDSKTKSEHHEEQSSILPPITTANNVNELELLLRAQNPASEDTAAALQAIKYFKKLEASDPIHLCRLLEIPFDPDRSFALSTSLLQSISVHMCDDPSAGKAFARFPVYRVLLREIVRLRQEGNEICKIFVRNATRKASKTLVADIAKRIEDKTQVNKNESILKWILAEFEDDNLNGNNQSFNASTILSSFLSSFK